MSFDDTTSVMLNLNHYNYAHIITIDLIIFFSDNVSLQKANTWLKLIKTSYKYKLKIRILPETSILYLIRYALIILTVGFHL